VKFILVRVIAPPEVVSQRLQRRQSDPMDKSDEDWNIYRKMQSTEEEIHRKHYTVDTSLNISSVINKIAIEALR
jgi:predicted kinase